ncbi:hypothetical protein Tco_0750271 [Tanacetum coccineum]|uniref:No apical meristem-associated C-terminal domain-containing protein n=1 Tax=Tanacetum coccineum TaxID=301880 RepID=A0ABQ4Z107_9ASTR
MLALQTEEGECSGNPYEPQPPLSTSQPINEEPIPNVASSSHQKTQTLASLNKRKLLAGGDCNRPRLFIGKALTKLVKKVKKLEQQVKTDKTRKRSSMVVSDEELSADDIEEDPSKQGRENSNDSTAGAGINTASPTISTASPTISAAETLVYIRRSATKDKGKGIMQETEQTKKMKKKVQIQMSIDEELAQKIHEDEVARFEQSKKLIQADEDLAQRMLEEEKESQDIEERVRLLAEFNDKRKKIQA